MHKSRYNSFFFCEKKYWINRFWHIGNDMVYTFLKNGNIWERFFVMHQYWFDGYSWEESLANHRWVKSDVEDPLNFFSRQVVSFDNPPIYLGAIMAGYEIKHSNSIRTKEGGGRRGFSRVESETTTSSKYHHKCDRETKYGYMEYY